MPQVRMRSTQWMGAARIQSRVARGAHGRWPSNRPRPSKRLKAAPRRWRRGEDGRPSSAPRGGRPKQNGRKISHKLVGPQPPACRSSAIIRSPSRSEQGIRKWRAMPPATPNSRCTSPVLEAQLQLASVGGIRQGAPAPRSRGRRVRHSPLQWRSLKVWSGAPLVVGKASLLASKCLRCAKGSTAGGQQSARKRRSLRRRRQLKLRHLQHKSEARSISRVCILVAV